MVDAARVLGRLHGAAAPPGPARITHDATTTGHAEPGGGPFAPGAGGLPRLLLESNDGAQAEVYLHGGHVTRWVPAGEASNRLFLSERARYESGQTIRGGVPVIFPQFATEGPLPKHGFARTERWTVLEQERSADTGARARLGLRDNDHTRAIWPHAFVAELGITIRGDSLHLELAVANAGSEPFSFTAALHSYFAIAEITAASVRGLRGVHFRDAAAGNVRGTHAEDDLAVHGELDRVFFNVPTPLVLHDDGRSLRVAQSGFPDVVVWNPGPEIVAERPDFAEGDERRMVCIEAAAVAVPIVLAPGARWTGSQTLVAR